MRPRLLALTAAAALIAAACSLLPKPTLAEQPRPCAAVYSIARCEALTDAVAADVGKNRDDVVGVAIVPDPPPEGATLGGAWPILVRIALKDGSTHETRLCGGVSIDPACSSAPHLMARSIIGGYTDLPCGTEPADGPEDCATPLPSPQANVVVQATPVLVEASIITIDNVGRYEVPLGEGSLPNGILADASFEFADTWPDDVALADGRAFLEVRSLEPDGKPFDNYYAHGWRKGVERIRAVLQFEVLWFAPGATLEIRNVVVR